LIEKYYRKKIEMPQTPNQQNDLILLLPLYHRYARCCGCSCFWAKPLVLSGRL